MYNMMKPSASLISLLLSALLVQSQSNPSTCDQPGGLRAGQYHVSSYVAEPYAPQGQQCIALHSTDEHSVSWHANWTWSEEADWMISAPYAGLSSFQQGFVDDHLSIPTTWEWSFDDGQDTKASAAYWIYGDGGCLSMVSWYVSIWLQNVGDVVPNDGYGITGDVIGTATISGATFDVHKIFPTTGGARLTYVYVAQEDQASFSGDLLDFLRWPKQNDGRSLGCVWGVQAGADVYGGRGAWFTTKRYTLMQNLA